ncbi:MAG: hypothetical protein H7Z37_08330 [Pyrinomonadaceae bacterium]|nr:hypothetical protein [Pyrinomonadaceae bacterium]
MTNIEREYEYKPKLWVLFLAGGFFALGIPISIYAASENRGLIINGIITLSPYQAGIFWLIIGAACAVFVLLAVLTVATRFVFKQRIALSSTALIMPKSRFSGVEKLIEYKDINSLSVSTIQGQTFLYVLHSSGKDTIAASMMPSRATFDDLCEALAKKIL